MPSTARHMIGLSLLGGLVLLMNLGGPRLWDRDEPRNAGCAVEMLERGDWVVPMFNGELRTHKPVLTYWLIMVAYAVFGVTEFSARVWSALLGVGTVLVTYGIGRRLFSPAAGLWAAVILLTTLMFGVAAHAATPDSPLLFFCTLATLLFVWDTFPARDPADAEPATPVRAFPRWPVAVLMYASMGLATLAKGPVGFVLPTAVIGMYLLIMRLPARTPAPAAGWTGRMTGHAGQLLRPFAPIHFLRTCWLMRPVTAMAVLLAVALPWYVLVGLRTDGQWLQGFFVEHHVGRATRPMEGHAGPLLFYPAALLVGFFPWSVFAVPVGLEITRRLKRGRATGAGLVLATCWLAVYLCAFSLAQTKLPSYITPCYPGVALLVAVFVQGWVSGQSAPSLLWTRLALGSLATAGLVGLVAVPIAAEYFTPGDQSLALIGLIPLVTAAVCYRHLRRRETRPALMAFATSAAMLMISVFAFAAQRVDRHRTFDTLLAAARQREPNAEIATLEVLEPSWVFYFRQPLDKACRMRPPEETPERLAGAAPADWGPKPEIPVEQYLARGPHRFVITTRDVWEQIDSPATVAVLAEVPGFPKREPLVLLGWNDTARVAARRAPVHR